MSDVIASVMLTNTNTKSDSVKLGEQYVYDHSPDAAPKVAP